MKQFALIVFALFISANCFGAWTESTRSTSDSKITLSSCTAAVRIIIDDSYSAHGTVRYSSSTIYDLINTAQRLLCTQTMCLETYSYQTLTADTTEYLLPDDCLAVTRVTLDKLDSKGPQFLPFTTVFWMDSDKGTAWSVTKSTPTAYYIRNRAIGMYPFPAYGTATLGLWYYKIPDLMDSESDYIFDGYTPLEIYWRALSVYAAYQIIMQEGGQADLLERLAAEYTGAAQGIMSWVRMKPDSQPNFTGSTYQNTNK